jgi:predicted ATPase with chaperone activity
LAAERGLSRGATAPLLTRLRGYGLTDTALAHLDGVRVPLGLSVRGVLRCARVARTIAALDRTATVTASHVSEALTFRREALAAFQSADSDML